ncbi:MAG: diguanylate cyclase [Gammaproteobacteria bacterium]|nr:diguanylate cyclase [Gammaproteobacteria bacterium]
MFEFLIIEDNRALANMGKMMIEEKNACKGVIASSRKQVNELISENPGRFSIAIVDLNLPDAPNGETLPDVIAANIPVIVLTGAYGEDMRQEMASYGVVDYVVKSTGISSYQYVADLVGRIQKNRNTKVLIIDDSQSLSGLLAFQLGIQRLKVLIAHTATEGLEIITKEPDIRLVFLDYNLPDMDGFEVCQKIRAKHGKDEMGIIGISGTDGERVSSRFLKSGANDFLSKPFGYEELLCRVNQNLETLDHIEMIRDAANRDYLTKLYNRRYFFREGTALFQKAVKKGSPVSVAMMDIDFFKKVNDEQGHDGGDEALRHIAKILSDMFPDVLVSRFGGEEFCILMLLDKDQAYKRLEKFRKKIEGTPVKTDKYNFSYTVSTGFTDLPGEDIDNMLARADMGLYEAKENGRNQVVYSEHQNDTGIQASSVRQMQRSEEASTAT